MIKTLKKVTKDEFDEFMDNHPDKDNFRNNCFTSSEPYEVVVNDFVKYESYPRSMIGKILKYQDGRSEYFIGEWE